MWVIYILYEYTLLLGERTIIFRFAIHVRRTKRNFNDIETEIEANEIVVTSAGRKTKDCGFRRLTVELNYFQLMTAVLFARRVLCSACDVLFQPATARVWSCRFYSTWSSYGMRDNNGGGFNQLQYDLVKVIVIHLIISDIILRSN